jgi:hypothetical protein
MTKPERAERVGLAIAVAIRWLVVIGAEVAGAERRETIGEVRAAAAGEERAAGRRHRRFVVGLAEWLAALVRGRLLPAGQLAPEPWPDTRPDVGTLTEQGFAERYP